MKTKTLIALLGSIAAIVLIANGLFELMITFIPFGALGWVVVGTLILLAMGCLFKSEAPV